ncbi:PorP/SprF family type IX secretion system membrane protein [Galbibacter mesophilus]|uniref:PorP/SprF family type IX secretion system membrane protein n=1 Tax=Galbibacter mesophilus TaxID=379069 RepID=UPI00191CE6F9|nr:type IX secretion system membrane protein PorP/SprF [Galbibacter mesophilus]MCM5663080.1 type IX secretion system membrane protein PorP/SprF [Galbibacter mesophilus]
MKNGFYKIVITFWLLAGCMINSYGQQDSQFTQYMYNTMTFNPAYAGTREVFSSIALYRNQWNGLQGAPETMNFAMHGPVGNKVGLGFSITNDQIFIANETEIDFVFSYIMNVSDRGKLSLGIKGGLNFFDIDFTRVNTGLPNGGNASVQYNVDNEFSPQVGAGAFYYTDRFYVGASVPNILETSHFDESENSTAGERLHLYFISGYVFNLSSNIQFKPAALVKAVSGAPLQVDISANFWFYEKFALGAAYRWDAATSVLAGFHLDDRWMIGYAYDWETTPLAQYNGGSHEIFIRFELFKNRKKIISPRFF